MPVNALRLTRIELGWTRTQNASVFQLCDGFFGPACVNPTPSTRLNLSVVAQVEGQLSPNWHSDGIFGLAFDASYDNVDEDQPSSLTKILNTFQDPQVTLFLKRYHFFCNF